MEQKNQQGQQLEKLTKIEQYTTTKLAQKKQNNIQRTESTKEQNKANRLETQYYAWKVEDHEIRDCKNARNILLRYIGSRYISTKWMNEKIEQYGTVLSIENRKGECKKPQK